MKKSFIFICLALVGCETGPTPEQIRAAYEARQSHIIGTCRGYGFQEGSAEYSNCLMNIDSQLRSQEAQAEAQRQQMLLQWYMNQQQQYKAPTHQIPPTPTTTRTQCYTNSFGYTDCTTR